MRRAPAHPRQTALIPVLDDAHRRTDLYAGAVVTAAIALNPLLSLINAHGFRITSTIVIVGQLAVTLAAAALLAVRPPRVAMHLFVAAGLVVLTWLIAALYNGHVNAKSLYDALLIPLFILLGTSIHRFPLKLLNWLLGVTVAVSLVEAFFPSIYVAVFNPLDYYNSTREWAATTSAALADGGLYQGANRAGGSWFSFLSDHRVGSIFLEPVSLGYFALVSVLAYSAVYRHNQRNYLIAAGLCLFLSLLADSRIPTVLILLLSIFQIGRVQLPPFLAAMAMPLVMLLAGLAYMTGWITAIFPDGDFRLTLTFEPLAHVGLADLMFGGVDASNIGDSGVLYLIWSFGLPGSILVFYLCCGFIGLSRWRSAQHIPLFVAIYVTTALLFGGAFFSIKTAALLGFFLGAAGAAAPIARATAQTIAGQPKRLPHRAARTNVRSHAR